MNKSERLQQEEVLRKLAEAQAEIARMRPVFRAAMHWYVCWTTSPIGVDKHARLTAAIDALDKACARAARKAKGKQ